jgi:hypothetical protein
MYCTDDGAIHGHLTALGRAAADFERGKSALYRSDGQQRYGDTEHAERMTALQATVDEAVGAAQEAADAIMAEQRTILLQLQEGDPLDHRSASEQTAAAACKAFVQEDCETLPPDELLGRCQTALAGADKATMSLLGRYVGRRVRAADQAAREGQPATSADLRMEQRQELGHAVEELLAKVRGQGSSRRPSRRRRYWSGPRSCAGAASRSTTRRMARPSIGSWSACGRPGCTGPAHGAKRCDSSPRGRQTHTARWGLMRSACSTPCVRSTSRGWEQRLQPLATHMAAQRLVRARGYAGAPVRQLDLVLLREALTRLLRGDPDQGSSSSSWWWRARSRPQWPPSGV